MVRVLVISLLGVGYAVKHVLGDLYADVMLHGAMLHSILPVCAAISNQVSHQVNGYVQIIHQYNIDLRIFHSTCRYTYHIQLCNVYMQ